MPPRFNPRRRPQPAGKARFSFIISGGAESPGWGNAAGHARRHIAVRMQEEAVGGCLLSPAAACAILRAAAAIGYAGAAESGRFLRGEYEAARRYPMEQEPDAASRLHCRGCRFCAELGSGLLGPVAEVLPP